MLLLFLKEVSFHESRNSWVTIPVLDIPNQHLHHHHYYHQLLFIKCGALCLVLYVHYLSSLQQC